MHVDALAGKAPDEVESIWLQFHEDPSQRRAADVMAVEEYKQMRVSTHPARGPRPLWLASSLDEHGAAQAGTADARRLPR